MNKKTISVCSYVVVDVVVSVVAAAAAAAALVLSDANGGDCEK